MARKFLVLLVPNLSDKVLIRKQLFQKIIMYLKFRKKVPINFELTNKI